MVYPVRGGFHAGRCAVLFSASLPAGVSVAVVLPFKHKSTACRRRLHRWLRRRVINGVPQRDVVRTRRLQQSLVDFGKLLCQFLVTGEPDPRYFPNTTSPQGWGFSRRVMEPVFVPIAVPYATEEDEDSPDVDADTASRRTRILPSDPRGTAIRFRWRTPKRMKKTRRLLSLDRAGL